MDEKLSARVEDYTRACGNLPISWVSIGVWGRSHIQPTKNK